MFKPKAVELRILLWKFYNNILKIMRNSKIWLKFFGRNEKNLIKNSCFYVVLKILKFLHKS